MTVKKTVFAWAALFVANFAYAATFSLFQPASGVLKGNPSTYVTQSANSLDIRGLWTGTCDVATFLRGDGDCALVNLASNTMGNLPVARLNGGTGASATTFWRGDGTWATPAAISGVTSVGLSAPSVFNVTGSPVTSTGTLALDWATGQTQNRVLASPNGSSGAVGLRALVGPDIPQIDLGVTGNGGVTGNLQIASFNGGSGASASSFWRGDGTWSGIPTANPTATVGLTAVNGSAATALRSDSAPALDQSIAPTWTGQHIFTTSMPKIRGTSAYLQVEKDATASIAGVFGVNITGVGQPADAVGISRYKTAVGWRSQWNAIDGYISYGNSTDHPGHIFYGDQILSNAAPQIRFQREAVGVDTAFMRSDSSGFFLYNKEATPLYFGTNNTERGYITSTGRWILDAPSSGTTLNLGAISGDWGVRTTDGASAGGLYNFSGAFYVAADGSSPMIINGGGGVYTLNSNGMQMPWALGVGTPASGTTGEIRATNNITAYYSSDARLKEHVAPITSALDKVAAIRGVEFDWTPDYIAKHGGEDGYFVRKHDVGVIAQEVQKVLPEVVAERPDGYLAVKYDRMVPLLIEAIKDLKAANDDLYEQVEALKKQAARR